ncbi:MAG: helix-hairpin-helix domain-containing protein [Daejeonella sp.]
MSILIFPCKLAFCQTVSTSIVNQLIEELTENNDEEVDYSELSERLNYYLKYPVEINKINYNQLKELFFLNPLQINNFLNHRLENGKLISLLELQSIDGFEQQDIKRLLNFIYLAEPNSLDKISAQDLLKKGDNELMIRFSQVLQPQKGYSISDTSTRSRYLGSSQKMLLRYRYNYGRNVSASLNLEKDPGEQLFGSFSKPFDFVSGNISFKNVGKISKLILGDYSLQFGQGLGIWTGLSFGKGAAITGIAKPDFGLKSYTSFNEYLFFRGVATSIDLKSFNLTSFISYRKYDASISELDSLGQTEINSISVSGYHRTLNEINNRNAVNEFLVGSNLQFRRKNLRIGLTSYQSIFNKNFSSGNSLYNQFELSGNSVFNNSFYYAYNLKSTYLFGEVANTFHQGSAYLIGAISSISPQVSIVLFHRNYQRNYQSLYNQAISESSNGVNEKGFYSGITVKPNSKFELNAYADIFKFPWLKYFTDAPSTGYELLAQLAFTPNKKFKIYGRFKKEVKEENADVLNSVHEVFPYSKLNYRLEINYKISSALTFRNRFELSQFQKSGDKENGYLGYQDIIYDPLQSKVSLNMRFAIFNTAGYDSRIYAYENDVLYSYSIPAYQHQGTRFYLNARYTFAKGIDFWAKYSLTHYTDLDVIGSGLDEIEGKNKSEIKFQIRYKF